MKLYVVMISGRKLDYHKYITHIQNYALKTIRPSKEEAIGEAILQYNKLFTGYAIDDISAEPVDDYQIKEAYKYLVGV